MEGKLPCDQSFMCRSCPSPFLPESPLFKKMLIHACNTNNSYKPSNQYEMSGDLLEANYVTYNSDKMTKLLMNVYNFGLGIFGDGATLLSRFQ